MEGNYRHRDRDLLLLLTAWQWPVFVDKKSKGSIRLKVSPYHLRLIFADTVMSSAEEVSIAPIEAKPMAGRATVRVRVDRFGMRCSPRSDELGI